MGKGNKDSGVKLPKLRIAYNVAMKCFKFDIFACNRDFLPDLSVALA